jgi:hypothetical protein
LSQDLPAPKVVADELNDVVDPAGVQLLQTAAGRPVVLASPALEHAREHHILGQGVLEAVHQLRVFRGWEDEIEAVELAEAPRHFLRGDLEDAREE